MFANAFLDFFNKLTFFNWVDIVVLILAVAFIIYGAMQDISGIISKLLSYLGAFAIGLWIYTTIRESWLIEKTYENQIGAYIISGILALIIGVGICWLLTKSLRLIVSQPYDSIIGAIASFVCFAVLFLAVLFLLKITPLDITNFRDESISGRVGYSVLDSLLAEPEINESIEVGKETK